jgi:hypothetical protein
MRLIAALLRGAPILPLLELATGFELPNMQMRTKLRQLGWAVRISRPRFERDPEAATPFRAMRNPSTFSPKGVFLKTIGAAGHR